jgi:hypothetical protein
VLTGVPAGQRGPDGRFPEGTVNHKVEERLRFFAERARHQEEKGKEGQQ